MTAFIPNVFLSFGMLSRTLANTEGTSHCLKILEVSFPFTFPVVRFPFLTQTHHLLCPTGQILPTGGGILCGQCFLPRSHPSFFVDPWLIHFQATRRNRNH
jgi:hypothetical protein